jgi:hypothetical protein
MTESQVASSAAFHGPYQTKHEHALAGDILKSARDALESTAAKFSTDVISDATVRARYAAGIRRVSLLVQAEVDAGQMSIAEGAKYCNQLRNQILLETRKVTSSVGRANAEKKKPVGPTLQESLDKYSRKAYGKPFTELSEAERNRVSYSVIESAGRNDAAVTAGTRKLRVAGKVGLLITGALAAHAILTAPDKIQEAARQGTVIQGGVLGGYLAGLATPWVCGPGTPLCALAVAILGVAVGSIATGSAFNAYEDEIKEFGAWGIR